MLWRKPLRPVAQWIEAKAEALDGHGAKRGPAAQSREASANTAVESRRNRFGARCPHDL